MALLEMRVIVAWRNIEPAVRGDAALIERVFSRALQRDEGVIAIPVREVEACQPVDGVDRCLAGPFEAFGEFRQLALARHAVEAADPNIDRMDFPASQDRHDLVADPFKLEPPAHRLAVILGHVHPARIAEEVGRMQHIDVQAVAADPFAAIEQAPESRATAHRR